MDPSSAIWVAQIYSKLSLLKKEIREMRTELGQAANRIESKLDEKVLVELRTAFTHLSNGFNARKDYIKEKELEMARGTFARLVELNPNGSTKGSSGEYSNLYLMALGYLGNFHYYNFHNEKILALRQVYECISRCFEANKIDVIKDTFLAEELTDFFSRDYMGGIVKLEEDLVSRKEALEAMERKWEQKNKVRFSLFAISALAAVPMWFIVLPTVLAAGGYAWLRRDDLLGDHEWLEDNSLSPSLRLMLLVKSREDLNKVMDRVNPLAKKLALPEVEDCRNMLAQTQNNITNLTVCFKGECSERLRLLNDDANIAPLRTLDLESSVSPVMKKIDEIQILLDSEHQSDPHLSNQISSLSEFKIGKDKLAEGIETGNINLVAKTLKNLTHLTELMENSANLFESTTSLTDSCVSLIESCDQLLTIWQESECIASVASLI
jgi:archaellum component FlaC